MIRITSKRQKEAMREAVARHDADPTDVPEIAGPPTIDVDPVKMAEKVSEEEVKKFLSLSKADIEMLDRIASGNPPRNAQAILAAIKMKLDATVSKPPVKTESKNEDKLTIVVENLTPAGDPK